MKLVAFTRAAIPYTHQNGGPVYINPDQVTKVEPVDGGTMIYLNGANSWVRVREPHLEVVDKLRRSV